jgi:hypothetical protein
MPPLHHELALPRATDDDFGELVLTGDEHELRRLIVELVRGKRAACAFRCGGCTTFVLIGEPIRLDRRANPPEAVCRHCADSLDRTGRTLGELAIAAATTEPGSMRAVSPS